MTEPEGADDEDGWYPSPICITDGDILVPDLDSLGEILTDRGIEPLAYQHREGQLFVLTSELKWLAVEDVGKPKPAAIRRVQ